MSGCSGLNAVNPMCRIGQLIGGAGKAVGEDVFNSIAHYFAGVAGAAVSWLWQQLNQATSIDLTTPAIKSDLIATGSIAALVTFALFVIQLIASAIRHDFGGLGRAVRGLGIAFIGAAFAIACTQLLLAAVDALANGVVEFALGTNTTGMGSKLVAAATLSSISNPAGLLLISLVLIAAVVVVWVALMIRKMLIIISAVFAPVAFAGASSDISRSWVRRWIEFTVALVFSKLILVIIFMIGLSVLQGAGQTTSGGGSSTTNSVTELVIGALTLLLAGFAPWIAIKMVHFAGETFHAVHTHAATATAGGQSVIAAPQKAASVTRHHPFRSMQTGGPAANFRGHGDGQPKSRPAGGSFGNPPGAAGGGPTVPAPAANSATPATAGLAAATATPRLASGAGKRTGEAAEQMRPERPNEPQ
jgi:type IV secretion system protein TrbL